MNLKLKKQIPRRQLLQRSMMQDYCQPRQRRRPRRLDMENL
jgi:hypothetical protein